MNDSSIFQYLTPAGWSLLPKNLDIECDRIKVSANFRKEKRWGPPGWNARIAFLKGSEEVLVYDHDLISDDNFTFDSNCKILLPIKINYGVNP